MKLVRADLSKPLSEELRVGFDRIVSAYVLHEFNPDGKMNLLQALARHSLAPGGVIIVGDVSFPTARERWADVWDEDECYWAADEAVRSLTGLGWAVEYEQVSECAGVFTIRPG